MNEGVSEAEFGRVGSLLARKSLLRPDENDDDYEDEQDSADEQRRGIGELH